MYSDSGLAFTTAVRVHKVIGKELCKRRFVLFHCTLPPANRGFADGLNGVSCND